MNLTWLIFVGGVLHFGILIASAVVPRALDWKESLRGLDRLLRQLIWVHGVFIALFWAARLLVQFFVFDAQSHLTSTLLKVGYHGLTLTFVYHAVVYSLAALGV